MTTRKITIPPFNLRAEDPDFHRYYGGAIGKLATAEAAVVHALEKWEQAARDNVAGVAEFSGAMDNLLGGIGREVMLQAWEVVETDMYRTIGASPSKKGARFERIFRDIPQAPGHSHPLLRDVAFQLEATDAPKRAARDRTATRRLRGQLSTKY